MSLIEEHFVQVALNKIASNEPIVKVEKAYLNYGIKNDWHFVLRNFNMNVYPGNIYVLLGPSECGKSSVLKTIIGFKCLNKGNVHLFGSAPSAEMSVKPGKFVGYMPQNYGLYEELTADELLLYYGDILGIPVSLLKSRIAHLRQYLYLPQKNSLLKYCSAGFKQQTSAAITLLHEPDLLILDEPAKHLDPLMEKTFFNYLQSLVKEKRVTVLFTTADLANVQYCNTVGIMRNGKLALEGNPDNLLSELKETKISSLYCKVYERSSTIMDIGKTNTISPDLEEDKKDKVSFMKLPSMQMRQSCCLLINCRRLWAVIRKDLCRLSRNLIWIIVLFLLPLMLLVSFGIVVGKVPKQIPFGIVNKDANFKDCVYRTKDFISCQLIEYFDTSSLRIFNYDTSAEAVAAAKNLRIYGFLKFGANYSVHTREMIVNQNATNENFAQNHMLLYLDQTDAVIASTIENILHQSISEFENQFLKRNIHRKHDMLYSMGCSIFNRLKHSASQYAFPALIVTTLYHLAAVLTATILISDRKNETATRDYYAGLKTIEVIISMIISCGFIFFIMAICFYGIEYILFYNLPCSTIYVFPVTLLQVWCGITFGVLISTVLQSRYTAGILIMLCYVLTIILCGVVWPTKALSSCLRKLVTFLPQTKAIYAVRAILFKNITLNNPYMLPSIIVPLFWIMVFTILSNMYAQIFY